MNIAMIKAGGIGSRMGVGIPKQFITIQGKPIIVYTLEQFEEHPSIDEIVVVCVEGWEDVLWSYAKKYHIAKLKKVILGGRTSLRSIDNGVKGLSADYSDSDMIIIHDGNRPVITQEIISDVIVKAREFGSAVAAIPCTDEIMEAQGAGTESQTFLDHKTTYRIQTPDAYRLDILKRVFDNATEEQLDNIGATNVLMCAQGETVHFARGSELNIRLTTQEDILQCEALLVMEKRM